jgi:hypothetical protein
MDVIRPVVTAHRFRRMALALDGTIEGAQMGHPDFRVDKRVFASLRHDDEFGLGDQVSTRRRRATDIFSESTIARRR